MLTDKQKRFVEAYSGNATEAAINAGYSLKSAEKIGRDLLRNSTVAKAIRERETKAIKPLIANRQKRQEFWTQTMLDRKNKMADRLKASELLGKSEGDFLERHSVSVMDKVNGDDFDVSKLSNEELDELIRLGEGEKPGEG